MANSSVQNKKLLFVDDVESIRLIAKIGLEHGSQWQVLSVSSGQEALDIAPKEMPDLILLDVMMPGMDGKETLIKLRENSITAQIPVIFVTAKVQNHELKSYLELGALGVISKPFDPMTLSADIEKILHEQ
jgi:two-component system OmpR family response regulator